MASTILIADDHPVFRRGLRAVIESSRAFTVVAEVANGRAALAAMRSLRPAIAVVDVSMPEIDGMTLLELTVGWPSRPVFVLLTMFDEHAERALDLGALGYVLKEDAERDVLSCLESVAMGRRFVSGALAPRLGRARTSTAIERPLALLTATERRVLRLVAQHRTSREIAQLLGVSHRTVQNHRAHVCAKLGLLGPHALVRFAVEHERDLALDPRE